MNRYWQRVVGFVLLVGQSGVLFAEDGSELPVYQLKDFIVRAWHFDRSVMDVPADVTRIEQETIDRSLALDVPDLLEAEANVFFSTVAGFSNVAMRGFGENSGLRTLILIDGQPLNPADMGRINWEQIPLGSIESIEVLRGGHNVLYGDKALSGVIKIETRRTREQSAELKGRMGSFGTQQVSALGTTSAGKWAWSAGAFSQESDGYRDNSASASRNAFVQAGRDWSGGEQLDLRFTLGEADLTYPGPLDEELYRKNPTASGNLGDEGNENQFATFTARAQGQRDWGKWELLGGADYTGSDWTFGAGSYGENIQAGLNLKPRVRLEAGRWAWIGGFDLLYDELDFTAYLDEARTLIPSEAELSEMRFAPYVFAEYALSDRFTVSGGVRYEQTHYEAENTAYVENQLRAVRQTNRGPRPNPNFKDPPDVDPDASYRETIDESGVSAEFSLSFRVTDRFALWAGYDRAYRYPVFDERAAYQRFPLAEFVARDLEAERGNQYEAGFKWLAGAHEIYGTAYFLQMTNEIIFDPSVGRDDPTTGTGLNRNLGAVDRYGADLAYYYTRTGWGFSLALAFVRTEMRVGVDGEGVGQEVPLAPGLVTTSQLWWEPVSPLRLRLVHRFVGERVQGGDFANALQRIEAYQLWSAEAELAVNSNCRVFVKGDNLFDERYAESALADSYYPAPGRSFQVGVKFNF